MCKACLVPLSWGLSFPICKFSMVLPQARGMASRLHMPPFPLGHFPSLTGALVPTSRWIRKAVKGEGGLAQGHNHLSQASRSEVRPPGRSAGDAPSLGGGGDGEK